MQKNSKIKLYKFLIFFLFFMSSLHSFPLFSNTEIELTWDSSTGSVICSWNSNSEDDLSGYKVYFGTESSNYTQVRDAGNVTSYPINDLIAGVTYFFAFTAYDKSGNESGFSEEIPFQIQDTEGPKIVSVLCTSNDLVKVTFDEILDQTTANMNSNYSISNGIVVQTSLLQSNQKTVHLSTNVHEIGTYTLTVENVKDAAAIPNTIESPGNQMQYIWNGADTTSPSLSSFEYLNDDFIILRFNESLDQSTLFTESNYTFSPPVEILNIGRNNLSTIVNIKTAPHVLGIEYSLIISDIRDVYGNSIIPKSISYMVTSGDTTVPRLLAVRIQEGRASLILDFSEQLNDTSAINVNHYSILPFVNINSVSLFSSGQSVILFTDEHLGGHYSIIVSGVADAAIPPNFIETNQLEYEVVVDNISPELDTLLVKSEDIIELRFSEKLDTLSAQMESNYSINPNISILRATVDASYKYVLLQTDRHTTGNYQLTVSGVKDIALNTIETDIYDYSFLEPDRTPPHLLKAKFHGSDLVELIFDEPLERSTSENILNYSINKNITISAAALAGDSLNHVYLSTSDHNQGETYTVTINNIRDDSPNHNSISSNTQIQYTYPLTDQTLPRLISSKLQGYNFIILTFSESLDSSTAGIITNYSISPVINIDEASLDIYGKKVYLKTGNHDINIDYTITVQYVKDCAGNQIGSENQAVYSCSTTDEQPPYLLRAEALSNVTVELKFNEALEPNTALEITNYSINNEIEVKKIRLSQSQQYVYLTTTAHYQGTYEIIVTGLMDHANNVIQSQSSRTYQYNPDDNDPPQLIDVEVLNEKTLEVSFNEPLHPESAENEDNYSISKGIAVEHASLNIHGTSVILQTGEHERGDYTLSVEHLMDVHKNIIKANTIYNYEYSPEDNMAPYILSAELENEEKLVVIFNESLDLESSMNKSNYAVNENITIKNVLSSMSGKVMLETNKHAPGSYTLTVNGIKDASESGNFIKSYSQIEYNWSPIDTTAPSLLSVALLNDSYLELRFSEALNEDDAQDENNYSINPEINIQQAVLASSLDKVYLVTESHEQGIYSVTAENIQDRAFSPNIIGSNNSVNYSFIPPDTASPDLVSIETNQSAMLVSLLFDEKISKSSAEDISNYTIIPDIDVTGAYLLSSFKEVHLETSRHQVGIEYLIEIRNLEDRSPVHNRLQKPITRKYTYTQPDSRSPELSLVKLHGTNRLELIFNEQIEIKTAENRENYEIDPYIEIFDAVLDTTTLKKVFLQTSDHMPGIIYSICCENIKDKAPSPNIIQPGTWVNYSMAGSSSTSDDVSSPQVSRIDVISQTRIDVLFTEPVNKSTAEICANYSTNEDIIIESANLDSTKLKVILNTSKHDVGKPYTIQVTDIYDKSPQHNHLEKSSPVKYIIGNNGVSMNSLSKDNYKWGVSHIGEDIYIDRDYTLEQIPQFLDGAIQIKTKNDDKMENISRFLNFEIRGDVTVYLAYDKRMTDIPEWLNEWEITGDQIVNSRCDLYQIYSREVSTGRLYIDGNQGSMDDNMYLVFIVPHFARKTVLADINKTSYNLDYVSVGDHYYIDRDYTIASIPDTLKRLLWIRTANDDKENRDDDFLQFTLRCKSNIFIAFDSNNPSIPRWLSDGEWQPLNGTIVDSRGSMFDLYYASKDSGAVAIGGNCGGPDDDMYFILINPLEDIGIVEDSRVPGYFSLYQNYPNPFNPSTTIPFTTIPYSIERDGKISLKIYNILGQLIKEFDLSADQMQVGNHQIIWDGKDYTGITVASGVYFYTIRQGHFATTERMLLIR